MEPSVTPQEWLNYHHLRYFHAVAREGSLSRAAEKLRASQPSICAQIKQLESFLGEQLYRRSGRSIALTDFGQVIYGYAEEIFSLGRELLMTARRVPTSRVLRLQVGIVDSFPKFLSLVILRPVLQHDPPIQVTCPEGKIDDLLGQLAAHRLDALLTDEPAPSGAKVRTFTHAIGSSGVTFCGVPELVKRLKGRFPQNLHGAPLLLPTQNTAVRRELERWFEQRQLQPQVLGEFEDAALAKIVAGDGVGITVVPTVVFAEAQERYGFVKLGETEECRIQLYLITAERRLEHPGVGLLARAVREAMATSEPSPGKSRPRKSRGKNARKPRQ